MSDKWEDRGQTLTSVVANIVSALGTFGVANAGFETHTVENTETGEIREVSVDTRSDQTLGEAIANGQFEE